MDLPEDSTQPRTRAAWRAWLAKNHARSRGTWVVYFKKGAKKAGPTYDDLVEEALCFAWIDSTARGVDEERTMLRFGPRKPGSGWARSNRARIERLAAAGLLAPAGLAAIEAAKEDGSWTKLDALDSLEVPDDLAAALAGKARARAHWDGFPPGARRLILTWIAQAKRPETRARRVAETARRAAKNERATDPER